MEFCRELRPPRPERGVEGLRPREPGGRGDDAGDGRLRLRGTALRHRVGLRPRAAARSRRASPRPRPWRWCPRPWRSSRAWTRSSSGASRSRRWRISTSRFSRWSRSACWARGSCPACSRCCRRRRSTASGAGRAELEFCPYLLPEFVFTGHEVCRGGRIEMPERYARVLRPDPGQPRHLSRASSTSTWRATCCRSWSCCASSASIPSREPSRRRRRVAGPIRRASSRRSWRRGPPARPPGSRRQLFARENIFEESH